MNIAINDLDHGVNLFQVALRSDTMNPVSFNSYLRYMMEHSDLEERLSEYSKY